jgi:hypothetical protein
MDNSVGSRVTFEKCLFEAYLAFRGVGGKKPDEGRSRWAQSHLAGPTDPLTLERLANKFHEGDTSVASYWINQILEAEAAIDTMEELTVSTQHTDALKALSRQRTYYESLCDEFCRMLEQCKVGIVPYSVVFGEYRGKAESIGSDYGPDFLDRMVRDTVIPSEDFEIVYAAIRSNVDLFVTDDLRLRKCGMSLGLNYSLAPTDFCSTDEYSGRLRAYREFGV